LPCEQCTESGTYCIAGPLNERLRERFSYDRDYSRPIQQRSRKRTKCVQYREDKTDCSLQGDDEAPPCQEGAAKGVDCALKKVRKDKGKAPMRGDTSSRHLAVKPLQEIAVAPQTAAIPFEQLYKPTLEKGEKIVRTAFIHPIYFSYDVTSDIDPFKPCHFCEGGEGFGAVGSEFLIDVKVKYIDGGIRYKELSRVKTKDEDNHTRICFSCTNSRFRIYCCVGHDVRTLPGCDESVGPDDTEVVASQVRLFAKDISEADKWCSVCPAPAFYECCTTQETNITGDPIDPTSTEAEGCGLLLCYRCGLGLRDEFQGDLQRMLKEVDMARYDPLGLRADAEFLMEDGLLERNMLT